MSTPAPTQAELLKKLNELSVEDLEALLAHTKWEQSRHKHQVPPAAGWTVWLMLAGRGAGKALCVETPIATAAGWKRMGDLCDGDMVFDEQGDLCTVIKAHEPYMPRTMYRLTFSDGTTIDADGEHLWTTLTHRARKQMTRHGITRVPTDWATYRHPLRDSHGNVTGDVGAETLTTEQLVESLTHSGRKDLNHCIPTAQPLNLPVQQLPIDPYLLGVWLGDGASKDQVIWSHIDDLPFMEAHIQALGYQTARKHDQGNTWSLRIQGFASQLKELGVFKNKHVPGRYLRASIEQRLALLRGLMDTDGYQSSKAAEFCNTNRALAEAVYELAVSLGEKPTFAEGRAKLYGRDCGERYRVTWRWNRFNPFSLPRKVSKMAAPDGQSFKHGHRMIVSIEPIEPSMVRCITVSSASRLYLAGEAMIPTHNTRAAAEWVWWEAYQAAETRWLVCAPTSADIRDTCFEGDSGLISVMPEKVVKEYNRSLSEIILINGSLIKGISAETPDRLRGGQWHGAWCDELAAWQYDQEAWDMIMFALRLGTHPRIVATTTPKPKALIRDLVERDGADVHVTRASTYENIANLAPTFQQQLLKFEGTTLGRQEIHAEVLNPEEQGIIKRNWIQLWPAKKPLPALEHIVMSLDTAFTEQTRDKKTSDSDPSACVVLGLFYENEKPNIILLDCWEDRLGMPDLIQKVKREMEVFYGDDEQKPMIKPKFGPSRMINTGRKPDTIVIEDKGSGISLRQMLAREGIIAHAYNPGKASKLTRLHMVSHLFAGGMVWFVESDKRKGQIRSWAEPLLYQLCSFSGEGTIKHDDLMDACTQGLRFLADKDMISVSKPKPVQPRLIVNERPRGNPYGV